MRADDVVALSKRLREVWRGGTVMVDEYKCYFIERDGRGRSLATIAASNAANALEIALRRFPQIPFVTIEVYLRSDCVLAWNHRAAPTVPSAKVATKIHDSV